MKKLLISCVSILLFQVSAISAVFNIPGLTDPLPLYRNSQVTLNGTLDMSSIVQIIGYKIQVVSSNSNVVNACISFNGGYCAPETGSFAY
ncbi:MAG TPA: hypothetical protein PLP88_09370, partial [Bacteroidales bacterium]|nr:hypothetical protein [Bacteroidales bacterium]